MIAHLAIFLCWSIECPTVEKWNEACDQQQWRMRAWICVWIERNYWSPLSIELGEFMGRPFFISVGRFCDIRHLHYASHCRLHHHHDHHHHYYHDYSSWWREPAHQFPVSLMYMINLLLIYDWFMIALWLIYDWCLIEFHWFIINFWLNCNLCTIDQWLENAGSRPYGHYIKTFCIYITRKRLSIDLLDVDLFDGVSIHGNRRLSIAMNICLYLVYIKHYGVMTV